MAASPGRRPTSREALSHPWVKMQEPIPSSPASPTQTFGRTETTSTLASGHWVEASAQWTDLPAQQIEPSAMLTNDFDTLRIQNNGISSATSTSIEKPPAVKLFQGLKPSPAIEFCCSIAFSHDGRNLVISGGKADSICAITIWDDKQGRLEQTSELKGDFGFCVTQVTFSTTGQLASSYEKGIITWEEKEGRFEKIQKLKSRNAFSIAFSPNKRWASVRHSRWHIQIWAHHHTSLTYRGKIRIWDCEQVRSGPIQELKLFPDSYVPGKNAGWSYAAKMAFSPDGRWLAAALIELSVVQIWGYNDQDRLELVQELQCHSGAWSIAFSANGKWLASGGHSNVVQIWAYKQGRFDLAQKLVARQGLLQAPGNQVTQMAFSPDGQRLVLGFRHAGVVEVWKINGEV